MDDATIETLAILSRIDLSDDERESLKKNLIRVLGYVDQLHEVDVEGIEPCNHVIEGMVNVMREDEVKEPNMSRQDFLDNAPDQIGGMIRVPPVLKGAGS